MSNFINGAVLSFSLIVAIGAQNIFVLQQGLIKNHIFVVCLICFILDAVLMACGIFGVGGTFGKNENFTLFLGKCHRIQQKKMNFAQIFEKNCKKADASGRIARFWHLRQIPYRA